MDHFCPILSIDIKAGVKIINLTWDYLIKIGDWNWMGLDGIAASPMGFFRDALGFFKLMRRISFGFFLGYSKVHPLGCSLSFELPN